MLLKEGLTNFFVPVGMFVEDKCKDCSECSSHSSTLLFMLITDAVCAHDAKVITQVFFVFMVNAIYVHAAVVIIQVLFVPKTIGGHDPEVVVITQISSLCSGQMQYMFTMQ